ncbi:hypothetical protein HX001_12185 [Empedobacter brevis]|uniref:Uncharacterized protein n=2 Tax=Empedobacter brevis TaxID=247 RepID=A0A511NHA7_9FLAO|nr:hypothetical protein [Empedobacter brevis]MDM1073240.1 hypothetical protein [Empedobacter brevis]GEM52193.1 hypothetical protein EB1_19830 [Empedobacter brevis NBRC 14943 = ATCC 43319]
MNKTLRNIILIICTIFIIWFIGYFLIGDFISLEFANQQFSKLFPKILTFVAAVSIYIIFLVSIKKKEGWSFMNIMKFVFGIIIGLIPLLTFEYFSIGSCTDWKIDKKIKKTLYQSNSSNAETIVLLETYCPESNLKTTQVKRVVKITPLFITTSDIDISKISDKSWKKL